MATGGVQGLYVHVFLLNISNRRLFQTIKVQCNEVETLTESYLKISISHNLGELSGRSALVKEGVANGDEQEGETKNNFKLCVIRRRKLDLFTSCGTILKLVVFVIYLLVLPHL